MPKSVISPSPTGLHVFLGKDITLAWISLPSECAAELGAGIVTNQLAHTDALRGIWQIQPVVRVFYSQRFPDSDAAVYN